MLESLGMSKNEIKVFEALLQHGKVSASEASAKSGVSYSRIYDILERLVSKELVVVVPEGTKKFVANDPGVLNNIVDKHEEQLGEVRARIKELKSFYDDQNKQPVQVSYGKKGFYTILREMKDAKLFNYAIKWKFRYDPTWAREDREERKRGIVVKTLTRYDEQTKQDVQKHLSDYKDIRKFDNDGVAMSIKDQEVMISLIKSNVTMLIRDERFCSIMKRMFEATYNTSESIEKSK